MTDTANWRERGLFDEKTKRALEAGDLPLKGASIGKEAAVRLADTKFWEGQSDLDVASFQLFVAELCMPFSVFHGAVERALGRPVFKHEFAAPEVLRIELAAKVNAAEENKNQ